MLRMAVAALQLRSQSRKVDIRRPTLPNQTIVDTGGHRGPGGWSPKADERSGCLEPGLLWGRCSAVPGKAETA